MGTRTLIGLSISPWTAQASFALDHAGTSYDYVEHTPMLGELALRRKARQKPASVPLLLDGDTPVMGALPIALHADQHGDGSLVPSAERGAVLAWHECSERILRASRALFFERLLASEDALRESLPKFIPGPLRGVLTFTAKDAVKFLRRKYDCADLGAQHDAIVKELEHLREELGTRETLLDRFTFADIAMACALNSLLPTDLEARASTMGPATHACWERSAPIERFPTLFAWRDAIYRKHRSRGRSRACS